MVLVSHNFISVLIITFSLRIFLELLMLLLVPICQKIVKNLIKSNVGVVVVPLKPFAIA